MDLFTAIQQTLHLIHSSPWVSVLTLCLGLMLGVALALSDWKSKLTLTSIITALASLLGPVTKEKYEIAEGIFQKYQLIRPILVGLNIAAGTFVCLIAIGTIVVFVSNYIARRRQQDPEALTIAIRRCLTILSSGLHQYVINSPDVQARNKIASLERDKDITSELLKRLVNEVRDTNSSSQHFQDTMEAAGRYLLHSLFGDGPELSQYRLAFFEKVGDKLEYRLTVNNHDWTSHSEQGFSLHGSFMGEAIKARKPLVYPRDKKRKMKYEVRSDCRYKSFIAVPIPRGASAQACVGVMTIDYVGDDSVFTEEKTEIILAFAQMLYAFYFKNFPTKSAISKIDVQGKATTG